MNASEPPLDSDVQIVQIAVPNVYRVYPFPVPHPFKKRYDTFYSQTFPDPPTRQGSPGDFFVGREHVYMKDGQNRWKIAHFSISVSHPFLDNVFLCYDGWGPLWTRTPLLPRSASFALLPIPVSAHFYSTLTLYHRQQAHSGRGNNPNDPISIED